MTRALATLALLRAWYGGPPLGPLSQTLVRAIAISAAACVAAAALPQFGAGRWGSLVDLALGGTLYGAVALLGIALAGDDAQRGALRSMLRRLTRR